MSNEESSVSRSPDLCLEPEDLAALIDGRLAADERARVLAHLGRCEACYELFEEAESITEALGEDDGWESGVAEHRVLAWRPRRWRQSFSAAALLAAACALVFLWRPWLKSSFPSATPLDEVTQAVVRQTQAGRPLAAGWENPPWSEDRGGETGSPGLEFRLGASVVALHVALRTGDDESALFLGRRVERMASEVAAAALLREEYREIADALQNGTSARSLVPRSVEAAARLERHLGASPLYALGSWSMAGYLATQVGATEHFTDPYIDGMAKRLAASDLPLELARQLRSVNTLLASGPEIGDLEELSEAFAEILATGGDS